MKNKLTLTLIFIALFTSACYCTKEVQPNNQPKSNTEILRKELAKLNIKNPSSDVKNNIKNNDLRFVGIMGFVCYAPGVNEQNYKVVDKYGIKCILGTSDMIEGNEHGKLIKKAIAYGKAYNIILLSIIEGDKTP